MAFEHPAHSSTLEPPSASSFSWHAAEFRFPTGVCLWHGVQCVYLNGTSLRAECRVPFCAGCRGSDMCGCLQSQVKLPIHIFACKWVEVSVCGALAIFRTLMLERPKVSPFAGNHADHRLWHSGPVHEGLLAGAFCPDLSFTCCGQGRAARPVAGSRCSLRSYC